MSNKRKDCLLLYPSNLHDALLSYEKHPDSIIFSGGTYLQTEYGHDITSDDTLISLLRIDELQKISRTENYLEIGACVTTNHILSIGKHVLPPSLFQAMISIGNAHLRNLATLGGNICAPSYLPNILPVLALFDTRLELRSAHSSRWVPISKLRQGISPPDIHDNEILTRIRISLQNWNCQRCNIFKFSTPGPAADLCVCALAHTNKGILLSFRFAIGSYSTGTIRLKELESELTGIKLPLTAKTVKSFIQQGQRLIEAKHKGLGTLEHEVSFNMLSQFVQNLQHSSV